MLVWCCEMMAQCLTLNGRKESDTCWLTCPELKAQHRRWSKMNVRGRGKGAMQQSFLDKEERRESQEDREVRRIFHLQSVSVLLFSDPERKLCYLTRPARWKFSVRSKTEAQTQEEEWKGSSVPARFGLLNLLNMSLDTVTLFTLVRAEHAETAKILLGQEPNL